MAVTEILIVESAPPGFRSFSTAVHKSLKSAQSAARTYWRQGRQFGGKSIAIVHVPEGTWTKEHWIVGWYP